MKRLSRRRRRQTTQSARRLIRSHAEQIDAELPHIYLYDRADIDLTVSNLKNYRINSWESQRSWNTFDWDFE